MATMNEIEKAAQEYSDAHDKLSIAMHSLENMISKVKRDLLPVIRKRVEAVAARKSALREMIDGSRDLFEKPKTRVLHGVKLGLQKGKGRLDWDDDDLVVKLIKKNFPEDMWEVLIKTTEKPRKDGLNGLDVKDLRRIGVTAEETGDQVIIKPTDSEIDKLVDALLKDNDAAEAA